MKSPKKLVLFSQKDLAGKNIAKILIKNYNFKKVGEGRWKRKDVLLAGVEGEVVYLQEWRGFTPEIAIVASRHSSKTGKPCLTAHTPGNFSSARLGGKEKTLGISPALYLREALLSLKKYGEKLQGYDISLEATHHGPTQLNFPLMFVEVGSTKKEWENENPCKVVAKTIYEVLQKPPEEMKTGIGFGGGHYCRKFSRQKITKEFALGHICPRYNLPHINGPMVKKMISRTLPKPTYVLAEKKGLGKEKQKILDLLQKTKLELKLV